MAIAIILFALAGFATLFGILICDMVASARYQLEVEKRNAIRNR